ncbi:OmpA family protein [Agarilytica rhodophyticola]|uniref:OmpA family protein n=1 Tax=Agarilytica rhodophyticola TaxID=1737490 RepID=UPI000B3423DA|nr:OmpA family protein [Agarilytica rhodophyticola]
MNKAPNILSLNVLMVFFACLLTTKAFAEIDLISLYPKATVFKKINKEHQRYQVIQSDIQYITDLTGDSEEGYFPAKSMMLDGVVERTVYDHTETDAAIEIAKNMRDEMKRKGFEILYECARDECGDVAGWRLYLSRHVDGYVDKQYYILAQHPDKKDGDWYVAFYVNEFTNIPRSIIHVLNTGSIDFKNYVINVRNLGVWLSRGDSVPLEGLFFEFDSADITKESYVVLDNLVEVLNETPEMTISIDGHTDELGSEKYNLDLSLRRAESVKNYLIKKGIKDSRLVVAGYGEGRPKTLSKDSKARAQNRRVEVVRTNG